MPTEIYEYLTSRYRREEHFKVSREICVLNYFINSRTVTVFQGFMSRCDTFGLIAIHVAKL